MLKGAAKEVIDEQAIVDGLTKVVNIAINRVVDEILTKKRIKVSIQDAIYFELVDKE